MRHAPASVTVASSGGTNRERTSVLTPAAWAMRPASSADGRCARMLAFSVAAFGTRAARRSMPAGTSRTARGHPRPPRVSRDSRTVRCHQAVGPDACARHGRDGARQKRATADNRPAAQGGILTEVCVWVSCCMIRRVAAIGAVRSAGAREGHVCSRFGPSHPPVSLSIASRSFLTFVPRRLIWIAIEETQSDGSCLR